MYWPLGVASEFSVPQSDAESLDGSSRERHPLISLSRSTSGHLLATVTATELYIWQTQVVFPCPDLSTGF
jgi:hypothetical protein